MIEIKDPAIKLFGKTIPVAGEIDGPDDSSSSPRLSDASSNFSADKELAEEEAMDTDPQTDHDHDHEPDEPPTQEESGDPPTTHETDEKDKDSPDSHQKEDEKESSNDPKNPQQKTIKKPDKILPCPRCNSMDTKFCYYNNYNINQPRHFCKSCQRYWTAGGTMRNVPVGAGRRKNKSSSSARYCHITVSEALQAAHVVGPNGAHHRPNGTVLTFGTESPLCESMVSVLNIADKKVVLNGITTAPRNGFKENGNGDDRSSGSTVTTTSSMDDGGPKRGPHDPVPMKQSLNGFPTPTTTTTATAVTPQMPCFQWPYMWNPAAAVPVPPFCPVPFYPAPYWNGAAAIPWNIPWVGPAPCQTSPSSNPNSPTLGKHSRDGEILENGEKVGPTILVPKTLRIDDPDEAAKSSIWTTLGIKKEKGDPNIAAKNAATAVSKGTTGFFNTLHHSNKGEDKEHKKEGSPALMKANPAALCRSITFQEGA